MNTVTMLPMYVAGFENAAQPFQYGLPHNGKRLTDSLAVWEAPVIVYPASEVGSYVARAGYYLHGEGRTNLRYGYMQAARA